MNKKHSSISKKCILIIGMHRSGTSALAGSLQIAGFNLGDNLMPANEYNSEGYFEDIDFYRLNDRILNFYGRTWDSFLPFRVNNKSNLKKEIQDLYSEKFNNAKVAVIKDPRISLILPVWEEALEEIGVQLFSIISVRNPVEIVKSLDKRDNFSSVKSQLLWSSYILNSINYTEKNIPTIFLHYNEFLIDPLSSLKRILKLINVKREISKDEIYAISNFLKPSLRHYSDEIDDDILRIDWVMNLYQSIKNNDVDYEKYNQQFTDFISTYFSKDIVKTLIRDSSANTSRLYINEGYGYEEINVLQTNFNYKSGEFQIEFNSFKKFKNITSIRWDPLEGLFLKLNIKKIVISSEGKEFDVKLEGLKTNGNVINAREIEFHTTDPWVEIPIKHDIEKVHIVGRIWELDTKNKFRSLENQLEKLKIDIIKKEEDKKKLRNEKDSWFNEAKSILFESKKYLSEKNDLLNTLNHEKDKNLEFKQENLSKNRQIDELEKERLLQNEKISDLENERLLKNEKISDLENERLLQNEKISDLENERLLQNKKIAALEKENDRLSKNIQKLEKSSKELTKVTQKNHELENIISSNSKEIDNLNKTLQIKNDNLKSNEAILNHFFSIINGTPTIANNKWINKSLKILSKAIGSTSSDQSSILLHRFVFDPKYYLQKNKSKLGDIDSNDFNSAIHHWLETGVHQGLPSSELFHVQYYLERNDDLKQVYGDDYVQSISHWVENGIDEARESSPQFDINSYFTRYTDVQRTFKRDFRKVVNHWIHFGKVEGRNGKPERFNKEIKIERPKRANGQTRNNSSQKKPVIIYESHNLNLQGAPNSLFEIASGIKSFGKFFPQLTTPSEGPLSSAYDNAEIPYIIHSLSQRRLLAEDGPDKYINKLSKVYKESNASLIHVNTLQNYHAILAASKANIPSIWNIRESEEPSTYYDYLPENLKELAYSAFNKTNTIVFVAEATRKIWRPHLAEHVKTRTISNGVKNERLLKFVYGQNRATIRASYGLKDDDIIIYNVGTVSSRKGQKDLIDCIRVLDEPVRKRIVLAMAGFNDSEYSIDVKEGLERLKEEFGFRSIIIQESSNEAERRHVAELYLASDIFILTSRIESYPRVILEAMEFRLPIISTPCFGVKEQLVENESVLYFEEEDIETLSEHIKLLVEDESRRKLMGLNSYDRLQKLNSYKEMVEEYQSLYDQIISDN